MERKIIGFRRIISQCWINRESAGQCYITALVVQDFFGGRIVRFKTDTMEESHYWNEIDGVEIDLTSDQFLLGDGFHPLREMRGKGQTSYRKNHLYSYPNTVIRYTILMKRVTNLLQEVEGLWDLLK